MIIAMIAYDDKSYYVASFKCSGCGMDFTYTISSSEKNKIEKIRANMSFQYKTQEEIDKVIEWYCEYCKLKPIEPEVDKLQMKVQHKIYKREPQIKETMADVLGDHRSSIEQEHDKVRRRLKEFETSIIHHEEYEKIDHAAFLASIAKAKVALQAEREKAAKKVAKKTASKAMKKEE